MNAQSIRRTARRTTNAPMQYKPNATGIARLPFVAGPRAKTSAPYWHVPTQCGGDDAFELGATMAEAFLKYLREERTDCPVGHLSLIAESLMVRFEQEGGAAMERSPVKEQSDSFKSLRMQWAGFFGTLSAWLSQAAKAAGHLDMVSEETIARRANDALRVGA